MVHLTKNVRSIEVPSIDRLGFYETPAKKIVQPHVGLVLFQIFCINKCICLYQMPEICNKSVIFIALSKT